MQLLKFLLPLIIVPSLACAQAPGQSTCKGVINISQTTTTDVHTFVNTGYICLISLSSAGAQNIGIDEGTGTTCETGGTALIGVSSTTAATPTYNLVAGTPVSMGNGIPFLALQKPGDHLCVLQSTSSNVSGIITYADLPPGQ